MSKSGKGSGFERELAKQLSRWWMRGERDDVMWRTSQSGGRATQRAKRGVRTAYSYGDLTFTDPVAQPLFDLLVISAKRGYRSLDVLELLDRCTKKGILLEHWVGECVKDCALANVPFFWLVFRRDRCDACLMMPEQLHQELAKANGRITLQQFGTDCVTLHTSKGGTFVLAALSEVLHWLSPESVAKVAKQYTGWKSRIKAAA